MIGTMIARTANGAGKITVTLTMAAAPSLAHFFAATARHARSTELVSA